MTEAIRVTCSSSDGSSMTRSYKTLKGAIKFATDCVGKTPEISETFGYAVCRYGVNKIEASVPMSKLFPKPEPELEPVREEDPDGNYYPGWERY